MTEEYTNFWAMLKGTPTGWDGVKYDIKELVTNPLQWATNAIKDGWEYSTGTERKNTNPSEAKLRIDVALDVLKWLNEDHEE